ncbi:hypothetical protein Hanom_Chr05g00387061 [Helianthus anomalus]
MVAAVSNIYHGAHSRQKSTTFAALPLPPPPCNGQETETMPKFRTDTISTMLLVRIYGVFDRTFALITISRLKSCEILYLLHHEVSDRTTSPYLNWKRITSSHLCRQDGGGVHGGCVGVGKGCSWCMLWT